VVGGPLESKFVKRGRKQIVHFVAREAERHSLAGELAKFLDESLALPRRGVRASVEGDERALAVTHFEQPLAAEPLIDAKDRVLVDAHVAGELPNRGEPIAGGEAAGSAQRDELLGDLPRDGRRGAFFDSQEHGSNGRETRGKVK
jgi:hypothetical protein